MAFYQKYRSQNFSELIGQDHISQTLKQAVLSGNFVHAYLLTGSRGIGKTSTARLLAKALNCENLSKEGEICNKCSSCIDITEGKAIDVMEIDAASHTGVDDVREIIEKSRLAPARSKVKVYIIDEVHMLSKSAFNALLKTLEEPPKHVVFIMATTEVHKIPETILSRAQRFDFKRAKKEDIVKNLKKIAKAEGIKIDDKSLEVIAVKAEGGHRDAVGLLEQAAAFSNNIKIEDIQAVLGIAKNDEILALLGAIFNELPEEGLKIAHLSYENGSDTADFFRGSIEILRKMLLLKISGKGILNETEDFLLALEKIIDGASRDKIRNTLSIFIKSAELLREVGNPLLPLEMAIIEAATQNSEFRIQNSAEHRNQGSQQNNLTSVSSSQEKTNYESPKPKTKDIDDKQLNHNSNNHQPTSNNQAEPTAAAPVMEMTNDVWERIIDKVKVQNSTLAALLKDAKPLQVGDGQFVIGAKFKFHKERISEPRHIKVLEETVKMCIGDNLCVTCKVSDLKPKAEKPASDDELLAAAEEIFN